MQQSRNTNGRGSSFSFLRKVKVEKSQPAPTIIIDVAYGNQAIIRQTDRLSSIHNSKTVLDTETGVRLYNSKKWNEWLQINEL